MKNIIYKEFKLVINPIIFIFSLLTMVLLIPDYPSAVGMVYSMFCIQIIFQLAEANKDLQFSAMLPVSRDNVVLSRHISVMLIQGVQIIVAIPFAVISCLVTNKTGNNAGMDANFAFFGMSLIAFAVFNIVFLPNFYKTGYKLGKPILMGIVAYLLCVAFFEAIVAIVPFLKDNLDSTDASTLIFQLPFLIIGIAAYAGAMYLSYKKSIKNFAKVTL